MEISFLFGIDGGHPLFTTSRAEYQLGIFQVDNPAGIRIMTSMQKTKTGVWIGRSGSSVPFSGSLNNLNNNRVVAATL